MLISELISQLQKAQEEHGDIQVAVGENFWDGLTKCYCNALRPDITLSKSSNYVLDKEYFCDSPYGEPWTDKDVIKDKPNLHSGEDCLVLGFKKSCFCHWFILNDASDQYKKRLREERCALTRHKNRLHSDIKILEAEILKIDEARKSC